MPVKIHAVFFDFDGVLVESMLAHARAWRETLNDVGLPIDEQYIMLHEGEKAVDTVSRLLRDNGQRADDDRVQELIKSKTVRYRNYAPHGLVPEARSLTDELKRRGIRCWVVTGSRRMNVQAVISPEEEALFEEILSAENYERGKPDPAPYLAALDRSGLQADECLVLENAPLGVQSATAAGLKTIAITTTLPPEHLSGADEIISSYDELLKFIQ